MPVHETTDRSLEEKTTLLLLGLLIAGCSTTNTLGGITCPHYDDACALARQNTFRANNGLPPQTMEQWWAMGQDDSGYSTSSATSTHQGRYCYGKTPMQTFLDAVPAAREKQIGEQALATTSA